MIKVAKENYVIDQITHSELLYADGGNSGVERVCCFMYDPNNSGPDSFIKTKLINELSAISNKTKMVDILLQSQGTYRLSGYMYGTGLNGEITLHNHTGQNLSYKLTNGSWSTS